MVWGGISNFGKTSLYFVEESLNGKKYRELLLEHRQEIKEIFARRRWWFQQDSAPCHRANVTKQHIERNLTKRILPHPAQSPDLNPIELIWANMKVFVERRRPNNKTELKDAVKMAWRNINIKFIRKCIEGLKGKMEKVIKNNGNVL